MIKNFYIFFLFAMLGLAASNSFSEVKNNVSIKDVYLKYQKEFLKAEKEQYESGNLQSKGFFRIRIFDGFMYLPNRYVLISKENSRHYFNSFPSEIVSIDGTISVGAYKDFVAGSKSQPVKNYVDQKTGLNVLLFEYKTNSGRAEFGFNNIRAVLHDGEQYISIIDNHEDLWGLMLATYEKSEN